MPNTFAIMEDEFEAEPMYGREISCMTIINLYINGTVDYYYSTALLPPWEVISNQR